MTVLLDLCYSRFGCGAWDRNSSQFPVSRVTGELNPLEMTKYRCYWRKADAGKRLIGWFA